MAIIPKTGFSGLRENWQSDLLAALSVSLVALPLALGIAVASDVEPIAGIISAIIGGVVTTFFRGSFLAINGPAAGLIAVILAAIVSLGHINFVLAAIVVSGALQVVLGLLKLGRLADVFHSSVIHGILAAIGVIILAKQIHYALGTGIESDGVIQSLIDAFVHFDQSNPFVLMISAAGLIFLIWHSQISYKFFHFLPAPMWVLLVSLPFVFYFGFSETHSLDFFGKAYEVGPSLLVSIPDNIWDAIIYPDFSKVNTVPFWGAVTMITLIASIESLASSKAVDKLDPYKRRTDLNKDLIGIGLSTMVSGALGGLPIITVIVRSSVNVHNNAKTKWSNLYHGIFLLIFVFLATPVIQMVPLCALAILLVFTGYKLASPKVFRAMYAKGVEQLVFFVGTIAITLTAGLLWGIMGGLFLALATHFLLAKVSPVVFFRMIFFSGSKLSALKDGSYDLKVKGIANFLSAIALDKLLAMIPSGAKVRIDLAEARLVDLSIQENLHVFQSIHNAGGGTVAISGLEKHISSTSHKQGLKVLTSSAHRLTAREMRLEEMAKSHGWDFEAEPEGNLAFYESFYFFKSRPLEVMTDRISGKQNEIKWEFYDVRFDEGAYMASEAYKITLGCIIVPYEIPKFIIEKKGLFDRFVPIPAHRDIDYVMYPDLSPDFVVKVENRDAFEQFMTDEFKSLIQRSQFHHLESNGNALLIFNDQFKLADLKEYDRLISFSTQLREILRK
ncbi:MAG: SulP family inorganic anion transporter [Flavobacteriales bacterium]|nr:SulP family inorganic anion transporter [Flavobacteriales bacterium]